MKSSNKMAAKEKAKRKTHTSTAVKQRYLDKTYKQFNCRLRNAEADEITAYLAEKQMSRADFIKQAYALMRENDKKYEIEE